MTRLELNSSKILKKAPLQTTGLDFSIGGFISVVDVINKHQKGCANPFVSIQLGGAEWPLDWINKLGGCTFANFGHRGTFFNKLPNMQFPSITYNKNIKWDTFASFRATPCWQTYLFRKICLHMSMKIFFQMSFGLPGPLRTPF